ncbi:Like-Sm (LSM) domain [Penicillium roqueforti FM164]|uniref:U6 snRNA-associated Sm-like protein LSm6 n=1 Tax=Penicillium roqueforti (strain FM164) TaxID=1365484 RepID=W6QEQ5_PENRF|nr:Like-Sm (LSM) domain [Penicillium roqueforti FM164]
MLSHFLAYSGSRHRPAYRLIKCITHRLTGLLLSNASSLRLLQNTSQPDHSINMENAATSEGKDPSVFLSEIIGAPVIVKLNSGVVYKGELQSVDGYMNIALEKTEEYVNGKLRRNYGDAFVRGNNVLYISSS